MAIPYHLSMCLRSILHSYPPHPKVLIRSPTSSHNFFNFGELPKFQLVFFKKKIGFFGVVGQSKWFIKKNEKKNFGTEEAPFIYLIEVTKGTHNHIRNMIMDVNTGSYSCT
jgi:hypothetical protein